MEEDAPKDIDPALLAETGRASAIQDLADQAKALSDRGKAIEETTIKELTKNNAVLKHQNTVLIYAVIVLVILSGWGTYRSLFVSGPDIQSIKTTVEGPLTEANDKLDGICAFIEEISDRLETPIEFKC